MIKSWSFSRYNTYQLCPLKARLAYIDKIPELPNDAMARGAAIHKQAEDYINGKLDELPAELSRFRKIFRQLKRRHRKSSATVMVEDTWAFKSDWTETTWNDWVGCWLRVKLDCAVESDSGVLTVYDWKTGRFRPEKNEEYCEQLELYALGAILMFNHVKTVVPTLVYLDEGKIFPDREHNSDLLVYTRDDIDGLKTKWEKRVKPMLSDKYFPPRPNNLCRWCHYRKDNAKNGGGQCQF